MLGSTYFDKVFYGVCSSCTLSNFDSGYIYMVSSLNDTLSLVYNVALPLIFSNFLENTSFCEYFFQKVWNNDSSTLLTAVLLDLNTSINTHNMPFLEPFRAIFYDSLFDSIVRFHHSEFDFIKNSVLSDFFISFNTFFFIKLRMDVVAENFLIFSKLFITILFLYIIFFFFVANYGSFFASMYRDEISSDSPSVLATLLFEAEKELGSIDDIIFCLFIVFFLFFWYFYTNFFVLTCEFPELSIFFYVLPLLYFVIVFIPTLLLYDFGAYFVMYLKGSANSSTILIEAVFDYIAVCVFYTRLVVQGVRLVLMLATFVGLNEVITYFSYNLEELFINDSFEDLKQYNEEASFTYFIVFKLSISLMYWLYELMHTFFVLTVQFGAFFAMVFWLFLFLYTFFVSEKLEVFIKEFREKYRPNIK